ncbi:DUF4405 domain-containing protein [Pseudorhodoferax sp. LjRoot39]|uniref:DUF4405 domain-containing protein n=1 Tax=Pseudorhodoferax sp. LjRoot39 TaxID=3342328 RepID=UPI003ECC60DD
MHPMLRSRLVLDLFSAGLLLLAMAYHWQGNAFHEVVGTAMFALVVAHNLLNRRWWGALARPRSRQRSSGHTALSMLLLVALLVLLATSVMISETVLAFLSPTGGFTARQVHGFVGYWVLAVVAIHIGLRWAVVMAAARSLFKITSASRVRGLVLRGLALGMVAAGVNSAGALGVLPRLLFEMRLDWWNFEESVAGFFVHCLLFAGALIVVTHHLQLLQRGRRSRTANATVPQPPASSFPTQPDRTP